MIYSIIYINFKWGNFKSVPIKVRARRGHPVSPPFPLQVLTLGVLANAIRKEKTLDHKPNHSYSQFRTFNFTVQQWPCEATRKCLWVVWLELLDSQCETGHFHAMLGGGLSSGSQWRTRSPEQIAHTLQGTALLPTMIHTRYGTVNQFLLIYFQLTVSLSRCKLRSSCLEIAESCLLAFQPDGKPLKMSNL